MDTTNKDNSPKPPKKSGLIRWNAIIPFSVIMGLIALYFILFFDANMRSAIEWVGFKALGTEVNVQSFKSSFIKGNVNISGLAITSAEKPEYNSIELGSIRFDVNWDALLRLKFVVEEMAVENIQFQSKRPYPGKVAPPKPESHEPGLVTQLKGQALNKVENQNKNNILGNLSGFLKTGDYKEQLNQIESQLKSKKMANDLKEKWQAKQKDWDLKIKALPNDKDLKDFKTKFEAIKFKDFKSPQEVDTSIKEFNSLKGEADTKIKTVNETKKSLTEDLSALKKDYEMLDKQIKEDIASIKDRLKIPKIDAKQIAKSMFMDYLTPYINKLDKINELAQKYLPPKYSKMVNEKLNAKALLSGKKPPAKAEADDDTIQPHPRANGVTYEFPIKNGYPLVWIQTIKISSKSNAQADYGDIKGEIKDIVSNQRQIGKQTEMHVAGDLNSKNIHGLKLDAFLNNLQDEPKAGLSLNVASYPLKDLDLVKSPDGTISIPSASLNVSLKAETVGFTSYDLKLSNTFEKVQFNASAKEKIIDEILKNTFAQLQSFDLQAQAKGELKNLDLDVQSSLGQKLQDALSASVQKKLDQINQEIKQKIDAEIGKTKGEIEKQINTLTKGYLGNATDSENKLNSQKGVIDDKIASAKKDLENKAKGKLQNEGKKALDDLKKKFKF